MVKPFTNKARGKYALHRKSSQFQLKLLWGECPAQSCTLFILFWCPVPIPEGEGEDEEQTMASYDEKKLSKAFP